jgi:hypothetical protein
MMIDVPLFHKLYQCLYSFYIHDDDDNLVKIDQIQSLRRRSRLLL